MNKWPDEMVDIIMDDISIHSSIHFFLFFFSFHKLCVRCTCLISISNIFCFSFFWESNIKCEKISRNDRVCPLCEWKSGSGFKIYWTDTNMDKLIKDGMYKH